MRRQDRLATLYSHAVSRHLHGASACMHPSHQLPAAANNVTHQRTGHGPRWIKVPERRMCLKNRRYQQVSDSRPTDNRRYQSLHET